jgi:cytochrome P450
MLWFRFVDHPIGETEDPEVVSMSKRTPSVNGFTATRQLLTRGLATDSALMQGVPGSPISRVRFGKRQVFLLSDVEYVDHVLHDAADRYHKSIEYEMLRAALGLNLFTDEDESWRRHRMMLNPVLAKRHLAGLCELMIDPIEDFMGELDDGGARIPVEMTHAMTELTLDVVGAALFGRELGDLARKLQRAVTDALRTAEVAARLTMVVDPPVWVARACAAFVHHMPWLPPPLGKPNWALKAIDKTVWDTIHHRQANPVDTPDLLGLLLHASDDEGSLSLKRVRDEATTFMLAGHETTANALAWMWYLLALNPDARDRMLIEVDTVLEGRRPTVADLRALPWTTACFQEAMRVMPPAWVIPRECVQDDEIDGHRIPKGATVVIPVHHIHHDERYWPDPEVFDPSRFLPENVRGRHRSAYLPFGGGRRICIGSSFALMETTLITAMMSQAFVYDLVPGHPVEAEATLTLRPRNGLKMIARRRVSAPAAVAA